MTSTPRENELKSIIQDLVVAFRCERDGALYLSGEQRDRKMPCNKCRLAVFGSGETCRLESVIKQAARIRVGKPKKS